MSKMYSFNAFLLLLCGLFGWSVIGNAQSTNLSAMEADILKSYAILEHAYQVGDPERQQLFGQQLEQQLLFLLLQPQSRQTALQHLPKYFNDLSTPNNSLRILSGELPMHGLLPNSFSYLQYQAPNGQLLVYALQDLLPNLAIGQGIVDHCYLLSNSNTTHPHYLLLGKYWWYQRQLISYFALVVYWDGQQLSLCKDCLPPPVATWSVTLASHQATIFGYSPRRQQFSFLPLEPDDWSLPRIRWVWRVHQFEIEH